MTAFCAICTSDAANGTMEPLGKNNALVRVCRDCSEQRPEHKTSTRSYEPTGGLLGVADMKHVKAETDIDQYGGAALTIRNVTEGYTIVRVAKTIPGARGSKVSRDRWGALATLRDKPWYRSLKALGSDARYHLFERPIDEKLWLPDDGTDFDPYRYADTLEWSHFEIGPRGGSSPFEEKRRKKR